MKRFIIVLAIILLLLPVDAKDKKPRKHLKVGQVFLVVISFMIGFCVTKEYLIEK